MKDCEVKDREAEVREDYLKNTPIIQLYSPEFYHEEQAIVMNETGKTALISALQSGQHVLPAFCSDGEGYYLILITGKSTEEIDLFKKPYTGDICMDCDHGIRDPRLALTQAEHRLLEKDEHALIRTTEYRHVVRISIKEYTDWRWCSNEDFYDADEFIQSCIVHGWRGIQNEYKTIADLGENAGHGFLPDYIFLEGFEKAREMCPDANEEEAELDPNHVNAKDIAVVWVEE
jgi:hypothetical protein